MSTVGMRRLSRIGGALYVIVIFLGMGEAVLREGVVVGGDAAATALHLKTMERLWRLGIASDFIVLSCSIALAVILYRLLRPVGAVLAGMAIFFNLVSLAVEAAADLWLVAAMLPQGSARYLEALSEDQRSALTSLAIRQYEYGFNTALIFFGVECAILGYLIYRSDYLPRVLGGLMGLAGACYLVNGFTVLLSPPLASQLGPAILLPSLVGESSLALYLLLKGIDEQAFQRRVQTSQERLVT